MPAKIAFPQKAKIAAFVCRGRRRPKVVHGSPKFRRYSANWKAIVTPSNMATAPQITVAITNQRTIRSSYEKVSSLPFDAIAVLLILVSPYIYLQAKFYTLVFRDHRTGL